MIMILWWVEYITSSLTLIILYSNSNFEVPPFYQLVQSFTVSPPRSLEWQNCSSQLIRLVNRPRYGRFDTRVYGFKDTATADGRCLESWQRTVYSFKLMRIFCLLLPRNAMPWQRGSSVHPSVTSRCCIKRITSQPRTRERLGINGTRETKEHTCWIRSRMCFSWRWYDLEWY